MMDESTLVLSKIMTAMMNYASNFNNCELHVHIAGHHIKCKFKTEECTFWSRAFPYLKNISIDSRYCQGIVFPHSS